MTTLLPVPKARFFDDDGTPLAGGMVQFDEAGTSTPKDTFSDFAGLVPNTNPVILDANGEADIRLGEGLYKVTLKRADGTTRWTVDNVDALGGLGLIIQTVNSIADLKDLEGGSSSLIQVLGYYNPPNTTENGFTQPSDAGGGLFYWDADSTDVDDGGVIIIPDDSPLNGRWVRVFDGPVSANWFGAIGDYILDNGSVDPGATDNTTSINNACSYARSKSLGVRVPPGAYLCSGALISAQGLFGDMPPEITTEDVYGSGNWNSSLGLEGAWIIWDKTLSTSQYFMRNTGDDNGSAQFKNIGFCSLSDGGIGGGILMEIDKDLTSGTSFNFQNKKPFENVVVCNMALGLDFKTYEAIGLETIEFRGCLQTIFGGVYNTDLLKSLTLDACNFKSCGDGSTDMLKLDYVNDVAFKNCFFDSNTAIAVRYANGAGVDFDNCLYQNNKNSSGPGGGTFEFLKGTNEAGAAISVISFYRCEGSDNAGDIDLSATPNDPTLTIMDSDLMAEAVGSNIIAGSSKVLEFGLVSYGTFSGTGKHRKITSDAVEFEGFEFDTSGLERQIKLLTTLNDESIAIGPTDSLTTADGSRINLKANLDSGLAANAEIYAGDGSNPGDIILSAAPGQKVDIQDADLEVDGEARFLDNVKLNTAGKGISLNHRTIAYSGGPIDFGADYAGIVTMSNPPPGIIEIETTSVESDSLILLTVRALASDETFAWIADITDGTSFEVSFEHGAQAGDVALHWMIFPSTN